MRMLLVLMVLAACGAEDPPTAPAGAAPGAATISTGIEPL